MTRRFASAGRAVSAASGALLLLMISSPASAQDLEPPGDGAPAPAPPSSALAPAPTPSDEGQDSGLGLEWVYVTGGGGGAYANMESLGTNALAPTVSKTASSGGEFDVGAGVRLLFVTAGLRARNLALSDFNIWELDAEAALHMRIWRIDPYFGARGGYVTVGSLSANTVENPSNPNLAIHGFNVGPMFGIDIYLSSLFSIGAEANAEFLILERPPLPLPAGLTQADVSMLSPQQQQLYKLSGSSVGLSVVGGAHLGIHF
jgi:hypothetical protein